MSHVIRYFDFWPTYLFVPPVLNVEHHFFSLALKLIRNGSKDLSSYKYKVGPYSWESESLLIKCNYSFITLAIAPIG